MNTYKTVIIDDEESARGTLKTILSRYFKEIEVVGEGSNVASGFETINSVKPELVFLDIKMPDGTGFDLLNKIDNIDFEVVFTTAYDNYAIKAFQASAMGYLLKPIDIDELGTVLEKIKKVLSGPTKGKSRRLQVLMENYGGREGQIKKLVIPNIDGYEVVEIHDLVRCEGERNYTKFILDNGKKILASKTLKEYEELLVEHGFFRIHKSHLVNLHHVKRYLKTDGGTVEMTDGSSLQLSREKKEAFARKFMQ